MPKFTDSHPMRPFTADQLNKLQNAPQDEFGVTHHDILFSEQDDEIYCVLDAPNSEAIHKHHAMAGIAAVVESVTEAASVNHWVDQELKTDSLTKDRAPRSSSAILSEKPTVFCYTPILVMSFEFAIKVTVLIAA